MTSRAAAVALILACPSVPAAEDTIVTELPDDGFARKWSVELGSGFAQPVVAANKAIVFHRRGAEALVEAFDAETGRPLWSFAYPTDYRDDFGFDEGPRSSPTIDGDRVLTYGAEGMLHCLRLGDGSKVWSIDLANDFGTPKGFFGRCGSPLVMGQHVIANVGVEGAGIIAFDRETGKVAWKATDDAPSYSSPVAWKDLALVLTRGLFVGVRATDGDVAFSIPCRPDIEASVTAAKPVLCGENPARVFISAGYGVGAHIYDLPTGAPVWEKEDVLDCHYATPVYRDGFLYGFHGRQERGMELRCIDAATGVVRWSSDALGTGSLTRVGDVLVVTNEDGELALVRATPDAFTLLARDQILGRGGRGAPVVANGLVLARDPKRLVCVDIAAR